MSLTYDAVGSGQVGGEAPRLHAAAHLQCSFSVLIMHDQESYSIVLHHGLQGQKNLFNRAYDYALSDVPIPTTTFNTLERKTLQLPFAISALDAVYSVSGIQQPSL